MIVDIDTSLSSSSDLSSSSSSLSAFSFLSVLILREPVAAPPLSSVLLPMLRLPIPEVAIAVGFFRLVLLSTLVLLRLDCTLLGSILLDSIPLGSARLALPSIALEEDVDTDEDVEDVEDVDVEAGVSDTRGVLGVIGTERDGGVCKVSFLLLLRGIVDHTQTNTIPQSQSNRFCGSSPSKPCRKDKDVLGYIINSVSV